VFTVVAPPSPVSHYCERPEQDGIGLVMRYLFPADGRVTDIRFHVESLKPGETATISIESPGEIGMVAEVPDGVSEFPGELQVSAGQKVFINVVRPTVDGVWVSFLYHTGCQDGTDYQTRADAGSEPNE